MHWDNKQEHRMKPTSISIIRGPNQELSMKAYQKAHTRIFMKLQFILILIKFLDLEIIRLAIHYPKIDPKILLHFDAL